MKAYVIVKVVITVRHNANECPEKAGCGCHAETPHEWSTASRECINASKVSASVDTDTAVVVVTVAPEDPVGMSGNEERTDPDVE